jgi:outer membrane protein assembly factor BamB
MVKYFFNLTFLILLLSGCNSKGKMKNPVDFTPKINVGNNKYNNFHLSSPTKSNEWLNDIGNPDNIYLDEFTTFSSYKILKNDIACDPIIINEGTSTSSVLYVLDRFSNIYKISCNDKLKTLWTYSLIQDQVKYFSGSISYNMGKLYITNGSRYIFVIDALSGDYIFEKQLPDIIITKPLVENNIVYLQDISNNLYGVHAENGNIVWQNKYNVGETLINEYDRQIWLYKSSIIALSSNGSIRSVNKETGKTTWDLSLINDDNSYENILIKDFSNKGLLVENNIYISNSDGYLSKIDIDTGKVIYKVKAYNIQTITKNGNIIILTNSANQVIAMNPENGKFIWSIDLFDKKVTDIASIKAPQIFNDFLYILSDKDAITKIDPSNGKVDSYIKIGRNSSSYISFNGKLYIFNGKNIKVSK